CKGLVCIKLASECAAMTVLLYFVSFASLFALFASASAGTFWLLTKFLRALMAPRASPKRRSDASVGLHPHHLKRAGQ
ncbi:MAG: hypothetical protein WBV43_16765, partial [Pseudolabrys sp.]